MRITEFSIRRYRVFDSEVTFPLSDCTVFVGPNNLGKSTILKAVSIFFLALQGRQPRAVTRVQRRVGYTLQNDYPKRYEGRPGRRWPTVLAARIKFSEDDKTSLQGQLNLDPPDVITLKVEFKVDPKFNRVASEITTDPAFSPANLEAFLRWFTSSFKYVYIPATRTVEDFSRSIFSELVNSAIQSMPRGRVPVDAFERFRGNVGRGLRQVERALASQLSNYLPSIKSIQFEMEDLDLLSLVRVANINVDDGAPTSLDQKGDGCKSLFVLSMLQFMAQKEYGANLIFGIEEPEAHLHSSATYAVKSTIRQLSRESQVLMTTHSPILLQRDSIHSNIIVDQIPGRQFSSSAKPASTLGEIRKCLGIKPHDNLTTSEVVVVVEGPTEERCVKPLLGRVSPELSEPLAEGRIGVLSAGGASKILATLRALSRDATSCLVLLDADQEGAREKTNILGSGLIRREDVFQVPARQGCIETEFEGVFDPSSYMQAVSKSCGIRADAERFTRARTKSGNKTTRMKKWSDVMRELTNSCGKDWDDCADKAKAAFGQAIADSATSVPVDSTDFLAGMADQALQYVKEG